MAYNNRYQYETSPRKIVPEYEPIRKRYPKKSTARKPKVETKSKKKQQVKIKNQIITKVRMILYVAIGFIILFTISYRDSVINEKFSQIQSLKADLSTVKKENEQLEVNIENNLNLKTIEQSAKELLGMQKLENSQIVYINLPKQDYVEPATEEILEEDNTNLLEKIINFITGK